MDSGFLYDNRQIAWDSTADFLSQTDGYVAHLNFQGVDMLTIDSASPHDRRELAQRWVNTQRRNTVADIDGRLWNWGHLLVRDASTGIITDIGFLRPPERGWDNDTSDITAAMGWWSISP